MKGAATFDTSKFADILRKEVHDIATKVYGGTADLQLGKAFAFWSIRNISWKQMEKDPDAVESARQICEGGGPGDRNVDGAWTDGSREKPTFFIIQCKYKDPVIPESIEEKFKVPTFEADPAEELEEAFLRISDYVRNPPAVPDQKLSRIAELYRNALNEHLAIELVVSISGYARDGLLRKEIEINRRFDSDRTLFSNHHFRLLEIDHLNQIVSDNIQPSPKPVELNVDADSYFILRNKDETTYAIACTVTASELVRIRNENGYNIYHSNFRFLLTKTQAVARPKIDETLKSESERNNFWRYNNGITVTCESITEPPPSHPLQTANVKKFLIKGVQVVNGLQTIEALYENPNNAEWKDNVKLMVRLIPTEIEFSTEPDEAHLLEEHIAEYSNSQTPIEPRDLRANDSVQREIERVLSTVYSMRYIRKVGEQRGSGRPGISKRVDNERAAQAAIAFWWNLAYEAKAKKRLIFEKKESAMSKEVYYEIIFNDQTLPEYILLPYLLWDQTRHFLKKHSPEDLRGPFKALDLLAVAVLGDVFRRKHRLFGNTSKSTKVVGVLTEAVSALQQSRDADVRKLWKNIFYGLYKVAEKRQEMEATLLGKHIDKISMRNIIQGMHYTDPTVRREIRRRPEIKRVPSLMKEAFNY